MFEFWIGDNNNKFILLLLLSSHLYLLFINNHQLIQQVLLCFVVNEGEREVEEMRLMKEGGGVTKK